MNKIENIRKNTQALCDAIILVDEVNQYYFTNFKFSDGIVLITNNNAYLITDFRYFEDAKKKASSEFEVVMPQSRIGFVYDALLSEGCKTIGFEDDNISFNQFNNLKSKLEGFELVGVSSSLNSIREVKDSGEIEKMRAAQKITDKAFSHIINMLTMNMTELDVALELEFFMRKNGADGMSFEIISVSGDGSALPHGKPRNEKLHQGFLTMDFGARYEGYCSDMTRTVCIGKANDEMKRLYDVVLQAQKLALKKIKAGELCCDIDAAARDYINSMGFEGKFGHSLGHGVGMLIHESPRLSSAAGEKRLMSGNIVTVEPGIYLEGKYGCRIEDMVLVTDDGCDNFTKSTKEFIEIC